MVSEQRKAKDLRQQSDDELRVFLRDKSQELLKLKFQKATGQLENIARVRQVKREIARVKTLVHEKKAKG